MADSPRSSVYHALGGGAALLGDRNDSFVYLPLITWIRNSYAALNHVISISISSFRCFVNRLDIIKIGAVANVLLWRKWPGGLVLLVTATVFWILFERAGYNILQFVSNVLLLLVAILFFWAKSASILNRPLPPLPDLEVSEEVILKAFDGMRMWINHALLVARDIAIHGNLKVLIQVASGLLVISYIGSLFNFLTLVYIGVLLSLSVPLLYEKYQDEIDDKLIIAHKVMQTQLRKLDENILRKIPMPKNKEKKTQ